MNITLNLTSGQYQTLLCPDCTNLYMAWYRAYIIFFGIALFFIIFIYIYLDYQLTKQIRINENLLKGICPNKDICNSECDFKK